MADVILVGGGVIGLSLARELADAGLRPLILEAGRTSSASWAAAGIVPPAVPDPRDPLAALFQRSVGLYPAWTDQLREESGVDPQYLRSGALYLSRSPCGESELDVMIAGFRAQGVDCEPCSSRELAQREPGLNPSVVRAVSAAWEVPDEAQVRSPRLLAALRGACAARNIETLAAEVVAIESHGDQLKALITRAGQPLSAGAYCFTAGAWSGNLLGSLGLELPVVPVRGQILLLRGDSLIARIVNEGPRYLVPRKDGQVLVGSTVEYAGFHGETTPEAIDDLRAFAEELYPRLEGAEELHRWAGLRPGTADGRPLLGRLPRFQNGFLAAGHFRGGLILAPITAQLMSQLILGQEPELPLAALAPDRFTPANEAPKNEAHKKRAPQP